MKNLSEVKSTLEEHLNLSETPCYIFGSRATGSHRENSDLDVLIDDEKVKIPSEKLEFLREGFEGSNLPYKVDLVLKSRIEKSFLENIRSDFIKI